MFDLLKRTFTDLKDEIISLKQKQKEINEYAAENNLDKSDPEYLDLMREYRNLSSAILLIRKRQTVEHLTNVGLLPNYAFPETGVTLKASVSRKRIKAGCCRGGCSVFRILFFPDVPAEQLLESADTVLRADTKICQ